MSVDLCAFSSMPAPVSTDLVIGARLGITEMSKKKSSLAFSYAFLSPLLDCCSFLFASRAFHSFRCVCVCVCVTWWRTPVVYGALNRTSSFRKSAFRDLYDRTLEALLTLVYKEGD
jgi:hypothetical protein